MAGWGVTLRGIRYRTGRSLVVLVLAVVATTAAVLAPAYARAAEQSVLTDALRGEPSYVSGITFSGTNTAANQANLTEFTNGTVQPLLDQNQRLAGLLGAPIHAAQVPTQLSHEPGKPLALLAYRDNVCAHLRVVQGRCPSGPDEVLMSSRSARRHQIAPGRPIDVSGLGPDRLARTDPHRRVIVGLYEPRDPNEPYWWNDLYFDAQPEPVDGSPERLDTMFGADLATIRALDPQGRLPVRLSAEYPLHTERIGLTDVEPLRHQLDSLLQLGGTTFLPGLFDDVAAEQRSVRTAVPIVAVPLVLLCWFVLFLVVASLTEERGPEIALAKLRGFGHGAATRFGLGEALVLIVLAAPIGVLFGLAATELAARMVFASGTHVQPSLTVVVVAVLALAGAAVAAGLAARRTLALPVLALLRRVPERGRWRATVVEGGVIALAAAALYEVFTNRTGTLSLLAAPLLALVGGLLAARLLSWWTAGRVEAAAARGQLARMLSAAQLARRPVVARIVLVLTVAVAVLTFGATGWDVAAYNRHLQADATLGADRVYTVLSPGPTQLMDAVGKADPTGRNAMAVLHTEIRYGEGSVSVLAADTTKLPGVALWRGHDRADLTALTRRLRPVLAPPIVVKGPISIDLNVSQLQAAKPLQAAVVVATPTGEQETWLLGELTAGKHTYTAPRTCPTGCRLVGLGTTRFPGEFEEETATYQVTGVRDGDRVIDAQLDRTDLWRRANELPATIATTISGSASGLRVAFRSEDPHDVMLTYADVPAALPVVLAGPAPADDPTVDAFSFPGFGDELLNLRVSQRVADLPRIGRHGMLFDLDLAARLPAAGSGMTSNQQVISEVWAGPNAPAGFDRALVAAGLQVVKTESVSGYLDKLSRAAPALALRLYLIAGAAAVLLAVGAVLLTAYVGVDARLYELAALSVAGVPSRTLRRGVLGEYAVLLGLPLVVGVVAGLLGASLMLPSIPLVTAQSGGPPTVYQLGPAWVPGAIALTLVGFVLAVMVVLRMFARATPDRLREGVR